VSSLEADVLVIGGGSTGVGVARDAALRGFSTILVERRDLADGTTGRFHGLLHSGGRYAVKDPSAARECIAENRILRLIASDCIEATGGLFVTTPWDDLEYGDLFLKGCQATGVPVEEIPVAEAIRREPRVNPDIRRAFVVPDAALDPWKLVWGCARSAEEHGARILPYHRVLDLELDGQRVVGARVRSERSGEELRIHASVVVNAAGAWAGQIAQLADCKVNVRAGMGVMIAMNHRLVNMCVNRCKRPADGDIILPIRTACVIGTTDVYVPDPDQTEVRQADVDLLLEHLKGELLRLRRVELVVQEDHLQLSPVDAALGVDRLDLELRCKQRRRVERRHVLGQVDDSADHDRRLRRAGIGSSCCRCRDDSRNGGDEHKRGTHPRNAIHLHSSPVRLMPRTSEPRSFHGFDI